MATNIELNTKINTANSAQSLKELSTSLKELRSLTGSVSEGSKDFQNLNKAILSTESRIGDLKTSFGTLRGTGIERLKTSLSLLQEGFDAADPSKLSIAFEGLKGAISAVPIFLLIEGFKLLVDNWENVVSFGKKVFNAFTDEEKAVNKATRELELQKKATAELVAELNNEIKILTVQGASIEKVSGLRKQSIQEQIKEAELTVKLNQLKLNQINNNDSFYESILRGSKAVQEFLGNEQLANAAEVTLTQNKKDRAKEVESALAESNKVLAELNTDLVVNEIETQKAILEEQKKARDLRIQNILDDRKRELEATKAKYIDDRVEFKNNAEALKQLQIKYRDDIRAINIKYDEIDKQEKLDFYKEQEELRKQAVQAIALQVEKDNKASLEKQQEDELKLTEQTEEGKLLIKQKYDQLFAEQQRAARDRELQEERDKVASVAASASAGFNSLQNLSDLYYITKSENSKKDEAEEERRAKKQFEQNKALMIAQTIISGVTGVVNALSAKSILPEPFATIAKIANVASIVTATAAGIAKIEATRFNSKGGVGGVGGGSGGSIGGGSTNIQTPQSTAFNPQTVGQVGGVGGGQTQQPIQKVVVVESDITRTQNKVKLIESQATFG